MASFFSTQQGTAFCLHGNDTLKIKHMKHSRPEFALLAAVGLSICTIVTACNRNQTENGAANDEGKNTTTSYLNSQSTHGPSDYNSSYNSSDSARSNTDSFGSGHTTLGTTGTTN